MSSPLVAIGTVVGVIIVVTVGLAIVGAFVKTQGYNPLIPDVIESAGLFVYNKLTGQG